MRAGVWSETRRTLADGCHLRTQDAGCPGWIRVDLMSAEGYSLYSGMMTVAEAFTEIPYQIDRARDFDNQLREYRSQ